MICARRRPSHHLLPVLTLWCIWPSSSRRFSRISICWSTRRWAPIRLFMAAREARVDRVVLVSRLSFFDVYPDNYLIDEMWRPLPATDPAEMAPFYAEVVARESLPRRRHPLSLPALLTHRRCTERNTRLP